MKKEIILFIIGIIISILLVVNINSMILETKYSENEIKNSVENIKIIGSIFIFFIMVIFPISALLFKDWIKKHLHLE